MFKIQSFIRSKVYKSYTWLFFLCDYLQKNTTVFRFAEHIPISTHAERKLLAAKQRDEVWDS